MGLDRKKRSKPKDDVIIFDPAKAYPKTNFILTAIFIGQLLWVFGYVLYRNELRGMFTLYMLIVGAAIVASEWFAQTFGGWLSCGPLSGPPFDNPLMVEPASDKQKAAKLSKPMIKFKGQFWQLVIHVAMAVLELTVLAQTTSKIGGDLFEEPWLAGDLYADNVPLLEQLYLVQMAIWVVTAAFHVWILEKQSDYLVMLGHHVATLGLVGVSFQCRFMRYGLMVLLIHDVSDIPIDLLKLTNYLKLEDKAGYFIVEMTFVTNLCSWIYLRLYTFPVKIIWGAAMQGLSALYSVCYSLDPKTAWVAYTGTGTELSLQSIERFQAIVKASGEEAPYPVILSGGFVAVGLLSLLFLMHIYWFFLFLNILHGILTVGGHEAGRQNYEGDDLVDSPRSRAGPEERKKME